MASAKKNLRIWLAPRVFTVSREIGELERQGVLDKGRGQIVVRKPDEVEDG